MTEQQTIPLEVRAVPPKVSREPKATKPTIPAGRATLAVADTAVLVGTGAVGLLGPWGALAGAGAAVGVPLAARAVRKRQERRQQATQSRTATTRTSTAGSSGLGRGSGRSGGSGGSTGRGSKSGAGSSGAGGPGRRLRNLLGGGKAGGSGPSGGKTSRGAASGGLGGGKGGGSRGSGSGGGSRHGSSGASGGSGGHRKQAKGAMGLWDRWTGRDPSLRQQRRHGRKLVDGLAKDGVKRAEWAQKRKAKRDAKKTKGSWWKRLKQAVVGPDLPAKPNTNPAKGVGTALRGQRQPTKQTPAVASPTTTGPTPVPAARRENRVAAGGMARLQAAADEMHAVAVKHRPEGNLEVVDGYHALPGVMSTVNKALAEINKAAAEQEFPPAVQDYTAALVKAQMAVVKAAELIGPACEKILKTELEYARNGGSARWDRRVNSGGGSAPAKRRPAPRPAPAATPGGGASSGAEQPFRAA